MKVLITGDSHTAAIKYGIDNINCDNDQIPKHEIAIRQLGAGFRMHVPFFYDKGQYAEITDPVLKNRFERLPPSNMDYDMIGFSGPLNTFPLWRERYWENAVPYPLKGPGQTITTNQLIAAVQDFLIYSLNLIEIIQRTVPVFIIEPPGPFLGNPIIKKTGKKKILFLHQVFKNHVLSELKTRGIPVVMNNPDWYDDEFMSPSFKIEKKEDWNHGNVEYGVGMIERIIKFINGNKEVCLR